MLKGRTQRIVYRTISNSAIPLWAEALKSCRQADFVFSKGLVPGGTEIKPYQITKRWYRLIKKKKFTINGEEVTIKADFYSLRHLSTTEIVDSLGTEAAAQFAGHNNTSMVAKVYDIRRKERIHEQLKTAKNKFVG